MNSIYLKIADFVIDLRYHKKHKLCVKNLVKPFKKFQIKKNNKKKDFLIILKEVKRPHYFFKKDKIFLHIYDKISQNQTFIYNYISSEQFFICIKNVISYLLKINNDFLIHSSSCLKNNKVLLFLGGNNTGKSTIIKMLSKKFQPINDDISYIRYINGNYYLYQSLNTVERKQFKINTKGYLIDKIYFLKKSNKFFVENIPLTKFSYYLTKLSKQIYTILKIKNIFNFYNYFYKKSYILHFGLNHKKRIMRYLND